MTPPPYALVKFRQGQSDVRRWGILRWHTPSSVYANPPYIPTGDIGDPVGEYRIMVDNLTLPDAQRIYEALTR